MSLDPAGLITRRPPVVPALVGVVASRQESTRLSSSLDCAIGPSQHSAPDNTSALIEENCGKIALTSVR